MLPPITDCWLEMGLGGVGNKDRHHEKKKKSRENTLMHLEQTSEMCLHPQRSATFDLYICDVGNRG